MSEDTFRWVISGGVAISTLCILALAVAAVLLSRVVSRLQERIDDVTGHVLPVIDSVRRLADENGPKISGIATRVVEIAGNAAEISGNARDISGVAKDQAHRFSEVGRDIADRTRAQVARVDAAVDTTIEQVQHVGENAREAVARPVREAAAILAGVKAAVSSYTNGKRMNIEHVAQDEEMFI